MAQNIIQQNSLTDSLARQNNTSVSNIMGANPNLNITGGGNLNTQIATGLAPSLSMPANTNIDVSKIEKSSSPLNIPGIIQPDINSTYLSAQNTIQDLYNAQQEISNQQIQEQQLKLDPIYQQEQELQRQMSGMGAEMATMQQSENLAERKKQLSDINSAILQQSAKIASQQYDVTGAYGATIQRDNAIKLAMLTASAQGLQGNITAVENNIRDAINLKYGDMDKRLQYTKEFISKNENILTDAQKKLADIKYKQTESQINKIEKEKEEFEKLMTNAIQQEAPINLIEKAMKAKTTIEAAKILGSYAGDYWALQKVKNSIQPKTGTGISTQTTTDISSLSPTAKSYLSLFNNGTMSLEDIYTKIGSTKEGFALKNEITRAIDAQGGKRIFGIDSETISDINSQTKTIKDLLKKDWTSISGPLKIGFFGSKGDALTLAKNVLGSQTLKSLADAKSKGITFGALSEGELALVSDAATRLNSRVKTKDGKITGFSGTEKAFKEDLQLLAEKLESSIQSKTGGDTLDGWVGVVDEAYSEEDSTFGYK